MTSSSVTLLWDPPIPDDQNGVIVSYVIKFVNLNNNDIFELNTSSESLLVSMLAPFTDYVWSVSAATAIGFGPFSEYLQTRTHEDGMIFIYIHRYKFHFLCFVHLFSNKRQNY